MKQGSGKGKGQPNGVAMVAFYLGHGEVDAAAGTPSRRCTEGSGEGVGWCGDLGEVWWWLNRAGAAYRGRSAWTASMAHGGDLSPPTRRGSARDVEARRSPGSGHVLEDAGRAVRVGEQRAGLIRVDDGGGATAMQGGNRGEGAA